MTQTATATRTRTRVRKAKKAAVTLWGVVRSTDGKDWIDTATIGPTHDTALNAALATNRKLGGGWTAANPIARVRKIHLIEA